MIYCELFKISFWVLILWLFKKVYDGLLKCIKQYWFGLSVTELNLIPNDLNIDKWIS